MSNDNECGSYCYNVAQLAYHFDYTIKVMFSFNHTISVPIFIPISIPITYYIIQTYNITNITNSEIIYYFNLYI